MKKLIKALVIIAIIAAIALVCADSIRSCISEQVIAHAITSITGSDAAGELAAKIADGEELSDAEIMSALGLDPTTYYQVKETAAGMGIDLNDGAQLGSMLTSNADEIADTLSSLSDGSISSDEALSQLSGIIGLSEAS